MPQKKRLPETERKSNPILGLIALGAVIAAIAVFLLTRPQSNDEPQAEQASSQPAQQPAAKPQSQPQSTPQTESTPAPQPQPQTAAAPAAAPKKEHQREPVVAKTPVPVPSPVSTENKPEYRIPAHFENPDQAEPLSATLDPATVPDYARAAYLIARKKPRLLAQLPCFCYCDRFGHKSLHDCYAGTHAQECDICMKEAIQADKMDSEGMTPAEIRDAIIAAFHPRS